MPEIYRWLKRYQTFQSKYANFNDLFDFTTLRNYTLFNIIIFSIYHLLVHCPAICMVLDILFWLVIILIKFNIHHTITQSQFRVGFPQTIPTKPRIMLNYQKHLKTQPVKKRFSPNLKTVPIDKKMDSKIRIQAARHYFSLSQEFQIRSGRTDSLNYVRFVP